MNREEAVRENSKIQQAILQLEAGIKKKKKGETYVIKNNTDEHYNADREMYNIGAEIEIGLSYLGRAVSMLKTRQRNIKKFMEE